jgi:hypothetical protein
LTEDAKKVVPWGTGWRYEKSDFPYELKGVFHPVALKNKIAIKKQSAKLTAGGPTEAPPDMHPELTVRAFMNGFMDQYISKISCD